MPDRILNDEQCQCLDHVLQSIAYTRDLLRKCKDCGLDTSKAEEELNAQEQLAQGLKRNFAPHRV